MCREEWLYDIRTETCYKDFDNVASWKDASAFCVNEGSTLASIRSGKDQDFLNGKSVLVGDGDQPVWPTVRTLREKMT